MGSVDLDAQFQGHRVTPGQGHPWKPSGMSAHRQSERPVVRLSVISPAPFPPFEEYPLVGGFQTVVLDKSPKGGSRKCICGEPGWLAMRFGLASAKDNRLDRGLQRQHSEARHCWLVCRWHVARCGGSYPAPRRVRKSTAQQLGYHW